MMNFKLSNIINGFKNTKIVRQVFHHFFIDEDSELKNLVNEINQTKNRLESARCNFDYAKDDEMIEYYTYIIKANEIKYGYLTRKYKYAKESKKAEDIRLIPERLKERRVIEWDYLKESGH